jgi:hypothetical protein
MPPHHTYLSLMRTIRGRLDLIEQLKEAAGVDFLKAESAAFQGRKIVEAIAFGCLVAVENGLNAVQRDAKGQWNAEDILKNLDKKNLSEREVVSRLMWNLAMAPLPDVALGLFSTTRYAAASPRGR